VFAFQLCGCVVGPLPPSTAVEDPQQSGDLSSDAAWHLTKKLDIKDIVDEESRKESYDSEDTKYGGR